jgi:hypothetical protein
VAKEAKKLRLKLSLKAIQEEIRKRAYEIYKERVAAGKLD